MEMQHAGEGGVYGEELAEHVLKKRVVCVGGEGTEGSEECFECEKEKRRHGDYLAVRVEDCLDVGDGRHFILLQLGCAAGRHS